MTPEHKAAAELAFNTKYQDHEPFAECPPHVQRLWLDAWEAATFHAAAICRGAARHYEAAKSHGCSVGAFQCAVMVVRGGAK